MGGMRGMDGIRMGEGDQIGYQTKRGFYLFFQNAPFFFFDACIEYLMDTDCCQRDSNGRWAC